jgi:hypothetical protein
VQRKCREYRAPRMILLGHGRAKYRRESLTGLVDERALVVLQHLLDWPEHPLHAAIQDLRSQASPRGRRPSQGAAQDGDQLIFPVAWRCASARCISRRPAWKVGELTHQRLLRSKAPSLWQLSSRDRLLLVHWCDKAIATPTDGANDLLTLSVIAKRLPYGHDVAVQRCIPHVLCSSAVPASG